VAGDHSESPVFTRFVAAERRSRRLAAPPGGIPEGTALEPLIVKREELDRLAVEAAKRAAGLTRPTRRTEVVWVNADSELAVGVGGTRVATGPATVVVSLPVRSDQTGRAEVHVTFAVGEPERPAGLYAATQRRPRGPELIVDTWGEAIVAFAWSVVLELITGLAGAVGHDTRGNRLVPVELAANVDALFIVPMARHRFRGSSVGGRGG
jgi:hypothetical protein